MNRKGPELRIEVNSVNNSCERAAIDCGTRRTRITNCSVDELECRVSMV